MRYASNRGNGDKKTKFILFSPLKWAFILFGFQLSNRLKLWKKNTLMSLTWLPSYIHTNKDFNELNLVWNHSHFRLVLLFPLSNACHFNVKQRSSALPGTLYYSTSSSTLLRTLPQIEPGGGFKGRNRLTCGCCWFIYTVTLTSLLSGHHDACRLCFTVHLFLMRLCLDALFCYDHLDCMALEGTNIGL